jgi:DNA-binding IscR family transcriptional regulator
LRVANRFAIAVHILSLLGTDEQANNTSEWMAGSIGVNPVIVRNVTGMLRRAGLVVTQQGVAGAFLSRKPAEITLLDVYRAVEPDGEIFSIHARPNPKCPVGAKIEDALEKHFTAAQQAMEARLARVTLKQVIHDIQAASG